MIMGVTSPATQAQDGAKDIHVFDIRSGQMRDTVEVFRTQAHVYIAYSPQFDKQTTNRVRGSYTTERALRIFLEGTALQGKVLSNSKVVIGPVDGSAPLPLDRGSMDGQQEQIQEVTISASTGTLILGQEPVGVEPITRTQEYIARSGSSTAAQLISRETQNFGGGPSEQTRNDSPESKSNSGQGVSWNLRALGGSATLVLINGRRVAPSGSEGSFVDIDNIPLGAISHIDIVPDGGSALYGTDAVGGIVNFVMQDRFSGMEMRAETGAATEGGQNDFRLFPRAGLDWGSGRVFLELEWYRQSALSADRRSFLKADLTGEGGPNLETPASVPPTLNINGVYKAIPAGFTGPVDIAALQAGTRNLSEPWTNADVIPYQDHFGADFAFRQMFDNDIQFSIDLLYSNRDAQGRRGGDRTPATVPNKSPLIRNASAADSIILHYDFENILGNVDVISRVRTMNSAIGVNLPLWSAWRLALSAADVRESEHQISTGLSGTDAVSSALGLGTFNPFVAGSPLDQTTLDSLRLTNAFGSESEVRTLSAVLGDAAEPQNAATIHSALGFEFRDQFLKTGLSPSAIDLNLRRQVAAVFTEAVLPVVKPSESRVGLARLDVSLAGRVEHYSIFGRAAVPRIGLTWVPLSDLKILATWGREIRAPNLGDLYESRNVSFLLPLDDPFAMNGKSTALIVSGKWAGLSPERSITRTAGFDWRPSDWPDTYLRAKYFSIFFGQRIQGTDLVPNLLTDPAYAGIVTRNPSPAARASVCNNPNNHFPGAISDCLTAPVSALIDLRTQNLGTVRTSGLDGSVGKSFQTPGGRIALDVSATYVLDFTQSNMPKAPNVTVLDTISNLNSLKVRGSLSWEFKRASLFIGLNRTGSYRDVASAPIRTVSAFTTVDAQLAYSFDAEFGKLLEGSQIALSVANALDRRPPFAADRQDSSGDDSENVDPLGRRVSVGISKRM